MVKMNSVPVNGNVWAERAKAARERSTSPNPFGRLVAIMLRNQKSLERLKQLGTRLGRAREYADDPDSNPALAAALIAHASGRYADALAEVRAGRAEALAFLRDAGRIGVEHDG